MKTTINTNQLMPILPILKASALKTQTSESKLNKECTLEGVFIGSIDNTNRVYCVSTDTHRMVVSNLADNQYFIDNNDNKSIGVILPLDTLKHIKKNMNININNDNIDIIDNNNNVIYKTKSIDLKYPNVKQVIKPITEFPLRVVLNTKEIYNTLDKWLKIKSNDDIKIAKFDINFANGKIDIITRLLIPVGKSLTGNDLCDYQIFNNTAKCNYIEFTSNEFDDNRFEVSFNIKYLFDAIKHIKTNEFSMYLEGSKDPAVITINDNTDYIIMPCRNDINYNKYIPIQHRDIITTTEVIELANKLDMPYYKTLDDDIKRDCKLASKLVESMKEYIGNDDVFEFSNNVSVLYINKPANIEPADIDTLEGISHINGISHKIRLYFRSF